MCDYRLHWNTVEIKTLFGAIVAKFTKTNASDYNRPNSFFEKVKSKKKYKFLSKRSALTATDSNCKSDSNTPMTQTASNRYINSKLKLAPKNINNHQLSNQMWTSKPPTSLNYKFALLAVNNDEQIIKNPSTKPFI